MTQQKIIITSLLAVCAALCGCHTTKGAQKGSKGSMVPELQVVEMVVHDTIPTIKTVTVTQEIEKPLHWYDKLCRCCTLAALLVVIGYIIRILTKPRI